MNLNKIMLIFIFLLAVLTIGVVSASENAENLEIENGVDAPVGELDAPVEDEIISQDATSEIGDGEIKEVEFAFPDQIKAGERFDVNVTLPDEAYGTVYYHFDDDIEGERECDVDEDSNHFSPKIMQLGKHVLNVKFVSDTPEICKDKTATKTYNVNDYGIEITSDEPEWIYGVSNYIEVSVPSDKGKLILDVNGEIHNYDLAEDDVDLYYTAVNVTDVNVTVTYNGDGNKLKPKTFSRSFKVVPQVNIPGEVAFGTSGEVVVNYVDDKEIKFILKDGSEENVIDEKTVTVSDSKAIYSLPDNLTFGEIYVITVKYENVTVDSDEVRVIPKMDLPGKFYNKKEYIIPIEFPQVYKNSNLTVSLNYNTVFEGKIGNDSKINVQLSNLPLGEDLDLDIEVYDSEGSPIYYYSRFVSVYDVDPSYVNLTVDIKDEYVITAAIYGEFGLPAEISGKIIVLIDDVEVERIEASDMSSLYLSTSNLTLGSHSLILNYTGDGYFEPTSKNYSFEVLPYILDIPDTLNYNGAEGIWLVLPEDATGEVTLYIDNKKVQDYYVEPVVDDEVDNTIKLYITVDEFNLKLGAHDFRIVYKGNKQAIDKSKKVNVGYTVSIVKDSNYYYGDPNNVEVLLPAYATGSFKILIDGKEYKNFKKDDNSVMVNISEFVGVHEIAVEYSGDARYNYPINVNDTFEVEAVIKMDSTYIPYNSRGDDISLLLPKNATGNLVLEIDDVIHAKQPLTDGRAVISVNNLSFGSYKFKVYYDGDDYEVEAIEDYLEVNGRIMITETRILFNESVDVYLSLPNTTKGYLVVTYGKGIEHREELVDGYAIFTVSKFIVGENFVSAKFESDEGESLYETEWDVYADPIFELPDKFVVFGSNTVTVLTSLGFRGTLCIEVDGEEMATKQISAEKTTLSLSKLTAGKHTLWVRVDTDWDFFSKSADIDVAKAANPKLTATSATVYCGDQYKATVLGVNGLPLKGAKVSFKVGKNKAVTRTTNAKGIAVLNMNYKPAKYTVVVKYAKQTLKPKVTVKKVLTLKTITVKKSARKLVLTATLKKGKTPIKGKVVTFKFNGKTYKAKTSKTGVAKYTIKKSVLNKLRVGKKVVYQATYLKNVVKKSAKVKR